MESLLRSVSDFVESLSRMIDHVPFSFWPDVVKTMIGSFVGAGLAFAFALWRDQVLRLRDQKAAGNLAMAILARQWSDFVNAKTVIEQYRIAVLKQQPVLPVWMQMKPLHFLFSDALKFDLASLAFLFEQKGSEILERLVNAETRYHDFAKLIEIFSKAAEQGQEKLSAANILSDSATIAEVEKVVGQALVSKMTSFVTAIFEHVGRSEKTYADAIEELRTILVKRFGAKGIVRVEMRVPQGLHQPEVPPLRPQ